MRETKKIDEQYMFYDTRAGAYHILFRVEDRYFRTTTGAFNQRDMAIVSLSEEEAKEIIYKNIPPPNTDKV